MQLGLSPPLAPRARKTLMPRLLGWTTSIQRLFKKVLHVAASEVQFAGANVATLARYPGITPAEFVERYGNPFFADSSSRRDGRRTPRLPLLRRFFLMAQITRSQCRQDGRRRFDTQDARSQRNGLPTACCRRPTLLASKSAFGPDREIGRCFVRRWLTGSLPRGIGEPFDGGRGS